MSPSPRRRSEPSLRIIPLVTRHLGVARWLAAIALAFVVHGDVRAADTKVEAFKPLPPPGIAIPAADRESLAAELAKVDAKLADLSGRRPAIAARLLVDVRVLARAVHIALEQDAFYHRDDVKRARRILSQANERADALAAGNAPWTEVRGLVVRGYQSKLDDSVQPIGLVVPESYTPAGKQRYRLDVWFHGRGDMQGEVGFIAERSQKIGQFAPANTIVLHPYGRYCNAFKFAGEVDVLEALEQVKRDYRIDEDRITVRGFSMGGAATWHFAAHYADRWAAANPGAGFAETARYLKLAETGGLPEAEFERKLWHWYDATDYAANLRHCPTVAYSGEFDGQRQAAEVMQQAMAAEGLELRHVIGPKKRHEYHAQSAREVDAAVTALAERGRERLPKRVSLTTYTLKYNRMAWVTIDELGEHWQRARVKASLDDQGVRLEAVENVAALTLSMPTGWSPFDPARFVEISVGDAKLVGPKPLSDRSWTCVLHRADGIWKVGETPSSEAANSLVKRHDLQGPIDDAFMDSFLFVRPSGKSKHAAVDAWVQSEMARAADQWRKVFRGDVRMKDDAALDDEDITNANLILWGDPASNSVLAKIADRLPIRWDADAIAVGPTRFAAEGHVLAMVFPNPLNPKRYVVLNSGFTFREAHHSSNARQVPRLPDWAIVDLSTPAGPHAPGKIAAADFFGERWDLRAK